MSDIKYLHQLAVSSNFYNLQEIGHENPYKETKRKVSLSNKVLGKNSQGSYNDQIEHFTNLDAPNLYKTLESYSFKSPRYSISDEVSSQSQSSSSSYIFDQKEVNRKKKKRKAKIFGLSMIPVVLIIIIIVIVVVLLTDTNKKESNCFIIIILI